LVHTNGNAVGGLVGALLEELNTISIRVGVDLIPPGGLVPFLLGYKLDLIILIAPASVSVQPDRRSDNAKSWYIHHNSPH